MSAIMDTGVIYALADTDDSWHSRCHDWLSKNRDLLVVPVTVIPEAAYLIRVRLGSKAELRFAHSLATGELLLEPLTRSDLGRTNAIMEAHPEIGLVDASVFAIAVRLKASAIATTDRRHFVPVLAALKLRFDLVP